VLDGRLRQNRHGCGRRSQAFAAVDNGWSMRRSFVFARPDQGDAHRHKGIALFPRSIAIAHEGTSSRSSCLSIERERVPIHQQIGHQAPAVDAAIASSLARRGHEKLNLTHLQRSALQQS
jgi:hypothetical protein